MPTLYGLYPNPGSTSFKCTELWIDYDSNATITGYRENRLPSLTSIPQGGYADAVSTAVSARSERRLPDVVGFKAVHGLEYDGCHECSPQVMEAMAKAIPLAPLHNPMFIEVIETVRAVLGPGPFTGAHFETSYGRALPRCARATGIPTPLAEKLGLWRRGFHGNSHLYASERCARLIGLPVAECRVITVHVGGSSSVASRCRGAVLESSMGATPESTDIPMGTRVGIYYGEMRYLMSTLHLSEREALAIVVHHSGLRGLSGKAYAEDLQRLYADIDAGDREARYALDTFHYRLAREIGAQYTTMGGTNAIAFTGGMSRSGRFLAELCSHLEGLNIGLNASLADTVLDEDRILPGTGPCQLLRIESNEELVVAQACTNLLTRAERYTDTLFLQE